MKKTAFYACSLYVFYSSAATDMFCAPNAFKCMFSVMVFAVSICYECILDNTNQFECIDSMVSSIFKCQVPILPEVHQGMCLQLTFSASEYTAELSICQADSNNIRYTLELIGLSSSSHHKEQY